MKPIVITRKHKHEAEQAVNDLLKRGYVIISPIQQIFRDGKTFASVGYGRRVFMGNTPSSCWRAVLKGRCEDV